LSTRWRGSAGSVPSGSTQEAYRPLVRHGLFREIIFDPEEDAAMQDEALIAFRSVAEPDELLAVTKEVATKHPRDDVRITAIEMIAARKDLGLLPFLEGRVEAESSGSMKKRIGEAIRQLQRAAARDTKA
jgi:hypothetical protein